MLAAGPAHFLRGTQADAHGGTLGAAEKLAPMIVEQVQATLPGLLAVRHLWHGRRNGRRDTARTTVRTAVDGRVGRIQDARTLSTRRRSRNAHRACFPGLSGPPWLLRGWRSAPATVTGNGLPGQMPGAGHGRRKRTRSGFTLANGTDAEPIGALRFSRHLRSGASPGQRPSS